MSESLISRDKKYCWGRPRIRGTRITVSCIKGLFDEKEKGGAEYLQKVYPQLTIEQIKAAINYGRKEKIK